MSFGAKILAAVRSLQAEQKLPPGLRNVERNARVIDKMMELGHVSRHELPSRWTLGRHLDRYFEVPMHARFARRQATPPAA